MSEQVSGEPAPFSPVAYQLKRPIQLIEDGEFRGNYVRTVTVHREPDFDDLMAADGFTPLRMLRIMMPRLTDLPSGFVGKLKAVDVNGLSGVINPLFDGGEGQAAKDSEPDKTGVSNA